MEQRLNPKNAAPKDAQIKSSEEEFVLSMVPRFNASDATVMDAQIKLGREEYVGDMGHTATPTTNLQPFHHALGQNSRKLL
jgi:hypothetical protein